MSHQEGSSRPTVSRRRFCMSKFRESEHLYRLALAFVAGLTLFLIARSFLVPRSFGQYGHFRGDALSEIRLQPVKFGGHQSCETCHPDVAELKSKGKHVAVNCESCHGALAAHADDPGTIVPPKLDTAVLCSTCHEANSAKPKWFKQVVSADHSAGLPCATCHQPHTPDIGAGAASK